jgi:hypothetical protein
MRVTRALTLFAVVAALVMATGAAPGAARSAQRCKIAHPTVLFVIPDDWACEAGYPTGLRFEAMAPSKTAFIDLYTAPQGASLPTLLITALKRHGLAKRGSQLSTSVSYGTVDGQRTFEYTARVSGVFDNFESGELRYSIYSLTRDGVMYVLAFSGVDPWATKDEPDFAAFIGSLRFA